MFRRRNATTEYRTRRTPDPVEQDVQNERPAPDRPRYARDAGYDRMPERGVYEGPREVRREGEVGEQEDVVVGPFFWTEAISRTLTTLLVTALVLAELVLILRLAFKLGTASTGNAFVRWIYHMRGQMVRPFDGIFSTHVVRGGGIFEPSVLIAMAVFLVGTVVLVWIIQTVASIFPKSNRTLWRERRHRMVGLWGANITSVS